MRTMVFVMAAGALLAGAAQAKDTLNPMGANPNVMEASRDSASQQRAQPAVKVLYVCDEGEQNRRAFAREFGAADFVTADQVRAAKGQPWSAPRCITPAEVRRLNIGMLAPVR